jgi:hypothetical protein
VAVAVLEQWEQLQQVCKQVLVAQAHLAALTARLPLTQVAAVVA